MNKLPRFAGLISVILAAVIIMGVYLLVGSVDLAFVDGIAHAKYRNKSYSYNNPNIHYLFYIY